jgi:hypothetical protein
MPGRRSPASVTRLIPGSVVQVMENKLNSVGQPAAGDSGTFAGLSGVHPVSASKVIATTPTSNLRADDKVILLHARRDSWAWVRHQFAGLAGQPGVAGSVGKSENG